MERNRFLELAAQHASGSPALVSVNGREYHPISYTITPKPGGGWDHSVRLKDAACPNSYNNAPLEAVEEVRG